MLVIMQYTLCISHYASFGTHSKESFKCYLKLSKLFVEAVMEDISKENCIKTSHPEIQSCNFEGKSFSLSPRLLVLNAAEEAEPPRYQEELQGVLRCPQGFQGSTHHVQPAAAPTQLQGSKR